MIDWIQIPNNPVVEGVQLMRSTYYVSVLKYKDNGDVEAKISHQDYPSMTVLGDSFDALKRQIEHEIEQFEKGDFSYIDTAPKIVTPG